MKHTVLANVRGARLRLTRAVPVFALLVAIVVGAMAPLSSARAAQIQDDGLRVKLSDPVLKLGKSTSFIVEVRDRAPTAIRLPEVENVTFGAISQPSVESRFSRTPTGVFRETTYIYRIPVMCEVEGRYEIPPIVLEFGSDEVASERFVLEVVRDRRGDALGYLQIDIPYERVVEGQTFPITVDFGCRASLYDANGTSFGLMLPWLGDLGRDAVQVVRPDQRSGRSTGVRINNSSNPYEASAPRSEVVDGESYQVMRLTLTATAMRTGTIDLSGTVLRIQVGAWQQGFFRDREFVTRDEFFKHLDDDRFVVEPLPEEDKPLGFTGAVGSFEAEASLDVAQMFVGDSFKLTVDYSGPSDLGDFAAPNLELDDAFADFAIYGTNEDRSFDRRRIVYDMAPLDPDLEAVPPVTLWTFDPLAWEYRPIRTQPQPIDVRARPGSAPLTSGVEEDDAADEIFERDIVDIETRALRAAGASANAPRESTLLALLGALGVAWIALRLAARREVVAFGSVAERRRALRQLDRRLAAAETPEQDLRAWIGFLAARSGEDPEAWVGRDVRAAVRRGDLDLGEVTTDLIARTSEHLEAAAYGDDPRVAREDVLRTARDLLEEGL